MSNQIKKNLSVLVIADIISKLLPLLTFPYITRVLGPEIYGKYGFAVNVAGFLMLLASPGFVPYGIRAVAQNAGGEAAIGAKINGIRMVFTVAAIVVLVVYTFNLAPEDSQIRTLLLLSALLMVPGALNLDWLLTGRSLITPVAVATILSQVVYTGIILLFVTSKSTVWIIPVATLFGEIICASIIYYVVWKNFGLAWPRFSKADFKEIVPASLLLGFASLMTMTYDKVDTIILGYFRSMAEVGVYTATYKIMWMVMAFLPILSKVFFPLIAGAVRNREHAHTNSDLYMKILCFASFPLMFGGMLLSEQIVQFILGNKYNGSGLLLALLLPNVLAGGMACYYAGMKLVAINKNKEYLVAVGIGALSNLVLNIIFIPWWGAKAAAVITCLSQFLVAGVAAWYGRGERSVPIWHNVKLPLFASLIMIGAIMIIMKIVPNTHVLVLVAMGAGIYGPIWFFSNKHSIV